MTIHEWIHKERKRLRAEGSQQAVAALNALELVVNDLDYCERNSGTMDYGHMLDQIRKLLGVKDEL